MLSLFYFVASYVKNRRLITPSSPHPIHSVMVVPDKMWLGRVHCSDAAEGFDDLQSYYGVDKKIARNSEPLTKPDAKFQSAKHLYDTSARFRNAVTVLEAYCAQLSNPDTSRTKVKDISRQMKKHIIPLLSLASSTIGETATTLAPIACVEYVHKRNETKRKNEVVDSSNKKMSQSKAPMLFTTPNTTSL